MDYSIVKRNILGPLSGELYVSLFFFSGLAVILMLYVFAQQKRDKNSPNTPVHFSWKFMLWDNAKKLVVTIILLFLIFRFSSEAFNREPSMWFAVGVGVLISMGVTWAIQYFLSKATFFQMDREKWMAGVVEKAKAELYNQQGG
ncbi:MAG TPA: hypothetical protein VFU05_06310 [Cyclobacteriaceae bacterium]|nr:hypothetical protein [Cyclobacteriaceae bacterium]